MVEAFTVLKDIAALPRLIVRPATVAGRGARQRKIKAPQRRLSFSQAHLAGQHFSGSRVILV